jgi:hypothetical protein
MVEFSAKIETSSKKWLHGLSLEKEDEEFLALGMKNKGLLGFVYEQDNNSLNIWAYKLEHPDDFFYTLNPSQEKFEGRKAKTRNIIGCSVPSTTVGCVPLRRYLRKKRFEHIFLTNPNEEKLYKFGFEEESGKGVLDDIFILKSAAPGTIPLYFYSTIEDIFESIETETLNSSNGSNKFPNPLHDKVLDFLLNYREKHQDFVFWLRERNVKNRLNEGFWFQGTDNYAFVGLYKASGGQNRTRSIGLVFWPSENGLGVSVDIAFIGEKNERLLKLYEAIRNELKRNHQVEQKGNEKFWVVLDNKNAFDAASKFLNDEKRRFDQIIEELNLNEIFISLDEFEDKVKKILEKRISLEHYDLSVQFPEESSLGRPDEDNIEVNLPDKSNLNVDLQRDTATNIDELGRGPFADAILQYIKRLWADPLNDDSYTLLINGEWGGGKSSVLKLLKQRLEKQTTEKKKKASIEDVMKLIKQRIRNDAEKDVWIVVEYNAWQNQHVEVPWWLFLDTVYKRIKTQSWWLKRVWIKIREMSWRLFSMNQGKWITFIVFVGILVYTTWKQSSFLDLKKGSNAKNKIAL